MDSAIQSFLVLIIVVVVIEVILVKAYRVMKDKQEARFTPACIGNSIDDIHSALERERCEIEHFKRFAKIAREEGDLRTEFFFLTLAKGEQVHVDVLLDLLRQLNLKARPSKNSDSITVGSTLENLEYAASEQGESMCKMYDIFARNAAKIKQREISKTFKRFQKAEQAHADIVKAYIVDYEAGGKETKIAMCPTCGTVEMGTPNAFCLVCSQPGFHYEKFHNFPHALSAD